MKIPGKKKEKDESSKTQKTETLQNDQEQFLQAFESKYTENED